MNRRLIALALAGTLSLGMLTACGGGTDNTQTSPSPSAPVVESTTPAPESSAPVTEESPDALPETTPPTQESSTPEQEPSAKPTTAPTAKPTTKPTATPKPVATPKPTATPAPPPTGQSQPQVDVVAAVWTDISKLNLPKLMALDSATLSSLYGINASDLVSYQCMIPTMAVHATEFFVAEVKDGKMDAVKAGIAKRQADLVAQWSQYLPEQLELVENYKVVTSGNYILFAVSDQVDQAVSIFNGYTK